jgi:hypothetical protein
MGLGSGRGPSFRVRVWALIGLLALVSVAFLYYHRTRDEAVVYADDLEHFKYGSIGSEPGGSLLGSEGGLLPPYLIFTALPRICPDLLPGGYASLGFVYEKDRDLPIGLSRRRRLGFDQVGVNCALCHVGTVMDPGATQSRIVPGMPASGVDVQGLMRFTLDCIRDPNQFTPENVRSKLLETGERLGLVDRILLPVLVRKVKSKIEGLGAAIAFLVHDVPASGPGRVDDFNPLKGLELRQALDRLPRSEAIGAVDFPHLWGLPSRDGRGLHWDGNLDSVDETMRSAVLGVGAKPRTVDRPALERLTAYILKLAPPPYPYPINEARVDAGAVLFREHCAACHEHRVGESVGLAEVGTDRHRFDVFTSEVATALPAALRANYQNAPIFTFTHFRKTTGYVVVPLDGIWARAPYLHNGSVPSLRHLLEPHDKRPRFFLRGGDRFDPEKVGFVALPAGEDSTFAPDVGECPARGAHAYEAPDSLRALMGGRGRLFLFDTRCPGNGNGGHRFGTDLTAAQKEALVEFLKTR